MNPLKRQMCVKTGCVTDYYCLYIHINGCRAITPPKERIRNADGLVRCPEEWEISAVRS